jgi:hypothetical protein
MAFVEQHQKQPHIQNVQHRAEQVPYQRLHKPHRQPVVAYNPQLKNALAHRLPVGQHFAQDKIAKINGKTCYNQKTQHVTANEAEIVPCRFGTETVNAKQHGNNHGKANQQLQREVYGECGKAGTCACQAVFNFNVGGCHHCNGFHRNLRKCGASWSKAFS